MGKRFTGETADIGSVVVEGDEVRITAIAGDVAATTTVWLGDGALLDESVEFETTVALSLAERIDASVQRGIRASRSIVDEDEGLREGPVVGSGPSAGFESRADVDAVPSISELRRRKAFAEAVIAECRAAEASGSDEDWIRIPNAEYADLVAAARREADFRDAFRIGLTDASNGGDGERPYLRVDFPTFEAALRAQGMLLRASNGHAFERPVPDDGKAPSGEIDIPEFVAATTGSGTASDSSDASQDDGGPVEPELDIDALVAAADARRDTSALDIRAVRSGEHPHLTVTVTGPGSADLVRRIISDILLPSLTEPLVVSRLVEDDVGDFATTTVDLRVGGRVATLTAERTAVDDLRKALAGARTAGGLR